MPLFASRALLLIFLSRHAIFYDIKQDTAFFYSSKAKKFYFFLKKTVDR